MLQVLPERDTDFKAMILRSKFDPFLEFPRRSLRHHVGYCTGEHLVTSKAKPGSTGNRQRTVSLAHPRDFGGYLSPLCEYYLGCIIQHGGFL